MLYKNMVNGDHKTIGSALLMSVTLLFSSLVYAQPGMEEFNAGVKAAESGDYRSALKKFQQAKKSGLDSAALQYNLGVVYYRLGQYEKAKKEFTGLKEMDNYQQLANYNLGLIANKQNKKSEAIAAFQRAYQVDESNKIGVMSGEAIKRLGAKPKKVSVSSKGEEWSGLATASFASDSNVGLDDDVTVSSKSDTAILLAASGANWLQGDSKNGLRLFLRGSIDSYNTETDYNYTKFGAGLAKYIQLGKWDSRFRGFWDETYLGGASFHRILTGEARARTDISANNQLRLRYRVSSFSASDSLYDYLDGTRHQLRAGMRIRNRTGRIRAYYEYEMNDRKDLKYSSFRVTDSTTVPQTEETVDYFRSYSPTRHVLRVTGWWDITNDLELRLDARYRNSEYGDENVTVTSIAGPTPSTNTVEELRKDTQTHLSARLSKEMSKNLDLEMTYSVTTNDSSIDAFDYDRNVLGAGLAWEF